ncbi:MAG: putative DNA helicase ino80 [Sclerophora amabilis]|nr:MAG: putative DNA helicase ino80 [Sclerophora amabilis]
MHHDYNRTSPQTIRLPKEAPASPKKTTRPSDPMAFSSILSNSNPESPPPPPPPPLPAAVVPSRVSPPPKQPRKSSRASSNTARILEEVASKPIPRASFRRSSKRTSAERAHRCAKSQSSEEIDPAVRSASPDHQETKESNRRKGLENESRKRSPLVKVEKVVHAPLLRYHETDLSDVDIPGFEVEKARFKGRSRKRELHIGEVETGKRKRRRLALSERLAYQLGRHAEAGEVRFRSQHAREIVAEVQQQEIMIEKERKKDMQRKRRREKTVQNEYQKRNEAIEKAQQAADAAEREKFFKEAQRAEKKAKATKMILQRGDGTKELREVTPLAPNLDGGVMDSFSAAKEPEVEPPKKKSGRGGARPRKSKEQKQAEKDAAEAAHAAMENNEPITIAPKEDRRESLKKQTKEVKEPSPAAFVPYVSKGYNQIYDQIWRDIARKDIPRVYRIKENSLQTKQNNLRKTAQLASKEARRWQLRTNKSMKDVQARAKRTMREMMSFWKRNEREERDLRRMAEKQEFENAKKAEADREANRQKRKLNFLISQTELYSHFIGHKIKTDEVERSTDDVEASAKVIEPGKAAEGALKLSDDPSRKSSAKVTQFENLDFDDDDETNLQEIARANAQNAVQEAQDRARAFNNAGQDKEANFDDEGEMNFQNPTSLVDMDVAQPKMLTAQLKEYQLKGLNWLVNLYEQGINGILADEMGLGKTVQSISVMGYLAENHNIWGPFLVIAPASTLHNWQQEISRFVPDLKVLPYWGNAKDRKVLRKFWDRKHITYTRDSPFHVLVTSYQLVVQDTQYFQKIRWQYMVLDEAQAIKSSSSSRWKSLLGFHCRNRLLLTGTPIQNNMQELWALLHFIMPTLFDSHDEFSDWFSKDIESHAQSNTKLNEDQLKRLHMILRPFMLRRIKKHVQKELGDKIETDVFCDLTYRQRAYYGNLRNRISIMDLIEKAAVGDDQDTATLMNLVMQFRKVCNHPDLFERADTSSPFSPAYFAETASFLREGQLINVAYSTRNLIEYPVPRLIGRQGGRLDLAGADNGRAGFRNKYLKETLSVWTPENIRMSEEKDGAFSWLRFADVSPGEAYATFRKDFFSRAVDIKQSDRRLGRFKALYDDDDDGDEENITPTPAMLRIVDRRDRKPLSEITNEGYMRGLLDISQNVFEDSGLREIEQCARPGASAPPVEIVCSSRGSEMEKQDIMFNPSMRRSLYGPSVADEQKILDAKMEPALLPVSKMLPPPISDKARFTNIQVPSMRRFVTDSGKLAQLDRLLHQLKDGGHRVLLYFQMTKMIDLMEEYLTYRSYKYLRLDGSTKLEDRRDTVHDFQTRSDIFVFLLSTRAGGLGINLTSADTVIFYDSDWNPTIDSQAMDRAHRLGQTKQVTVYRMITSGTIEERIRKRALQKEEVQRVVISGGSGAGVDFNTRSKENRTKDIALWLADDDQAAEIERKEAEIAAAEAKEPPSGKKKAASKKRKADISLDDMYHEGEGHFDDGSNKPSGAATPVDGAGAGAGPNTAAPGRGGKKGATKRSGAGISKKAKTAKERLRIADGEVDMGLAGGR